MQQYRQKIEELSYGLEKGGFTPVAARVINYLLIKPEGEATFDELLEFFGVSKSAVSNALKMLEAMDLVVSRTKSGARKRYFSPTFEKHITIEAMLEHHKKMKNLMQDILKIRNSDQQIDKEMYLIVSFLDMMEEEMPLLFEKYKKKHLKKK